MSPMWTSLDPFVIFIVGFGIYIGIVRGLENIKQTRYGNLPAAEKSRNNNYFFFIDYN